MMNRLLEKLSGGDLRSLGNANAVANLVQSQKQFDELFEGLFCGDRLVVMRAADAIEKVTRKEPSYLHPHKQPLLGLLKTARDKELKWHLALLVPRLKLTKPEVRKVWVTLSHWALDTSESRIVRVNSVQALFDLSNILPALTYDFEQTLLQLEMQRVPSITARIKKLRKQRGKNVSVSNTTNPKKSS